ncbi:hypothetical protein OC845_006014 [Tilletia horrida]|nr:hypothetical protein OC845_006014 [Tilletia horrida]
MKTDIETIRVYGKSSLSTATGAIKELTDSVSKQTRSQSNNCIQYAHEWDTRSRSLLAETTKLSAARTHAQGIPLRCKCPFPETWETIPQVSPTSQFPYFTFSVQGLPKPPATGPSLPTPRATGSQDGEFPVPALPVTLRRHAGLPTGVSLTPSAF